MYVRVHAHVHLADIMYIRSLLVNKQEAAEAAHVAEHLHTASVARDHVPQEVGDEVGGGGA